MFRSIESTFSLSAQLSSAQLIHTFTKHSPSHEQTIPTNPMNEEKKCVCLSLLYGEWKAQ